MMQMNFPQNRNRLIDIEKRLVAGGVQGSDALGV